MTIERSILAKFSCDDKVSISSYHTMNGHLYIGTSSNGTVYKTIDGFDLTEFYKTGEYSVTAISDYGNALFVGTSSYGKIFMHNFNTGNRFYYVSTGDYQVTSFCTYKNVLYAGTSPSGMVFSFDGTEWRLIYDCYGGGIKSMNVFGESMYIFVDQIEFVPCLTDGKWSFLKSDAKTFSISAFKKAKTSLTQLQKNLNFDWSFSAACVCGGKLYFAPINKCNLYVYNGTTVEMFYQWDGEKINSIEAVGDSQLFVAVDDSIYSVEIS